jgi:hypothetical protein
MRHYSSAQWVDFARNVTGTRDRAEMQSHLSKGCKKCSRTLGLWQRVYEVGRRERGHAPPDNIITTVLKEHVRNPRASQSRMQGRRSCQPLVHGHLVAIPETIIAVRRWGMLIVVEVPMLDGRPVDAFGWGADYDRFNSK